jgi:two-component system, OmpR family, phosphate regulon sensor histidine kinase PhoR
MPSVSTHYRGKPDDNQVNVGLQSETNSSFAYLLLNHLDTAACCLNAAGQFICVNRALCDLLELSTQEPESIALYNFEPSGSLSLWQDHWQLLKQERSLTYPVQYYLKSGKVLFARVKITYVQHKGQELACAVFNTEPSSDKATAESSLELRKPLSDIKAQFVPILCYQFRSLLNIISFSNSLLKRNLNRWNAAEKQPYIDHIQTAVDRITQLLEQSILLGKSLTGAIHPKTVSINLTSFCQEVLAQIQPLLEANQQKMTFTISEENCLVDPYLLHITLINLLSNASNYSPPHSIIELTVLCHSQSLDIQIRDAGIGIPETDQQRLFEPFYRGSNVDDRSGVGLGLALVKNLVESQGGQIKLTSTLDVGTTVDFSLPLSSKP